MNDRKYCVYFHKRKTDGIVYYIGSGVKNKREYHFNNRSKSWHEAHEKHGTIVEIYRDSLTVTEARSLEKDLILSGEFKDLVNKKLPCKAKSVDVIKEAMLSVAYDPLSPTFLRWVNITGPVSKHRGFAGTLTYDKQGNPRGAYVQINKVMLRISRVIWVLHGFDIPENYIIDHIDGNPHNNDINNLRCISLEHNSRNRKDQSKKDKNLPKGMSIKNGSILVSVTCSGVLVSKAYSINKYGYETALNKASSFRLSNLSEFGTLDSYSDRHLDFEIPSDLDYSHTTSAASGFKNIWVKRDKEGNIKTISAGIGRKNRKHFTISDKLTIDEAISMGNAYIEYQKAMLPAKTSRAGDGMAKGSGNGTSDVVAGTDSSSLNSNNAA